MPGVYTRAERPGIACPDPEQDQAPAPVTVARGRDPEMTGSITRAQVAKVELPPGPQRVVAPSAARVAAEYIRTLIFEGVLREGDRVSYDEIAERLDMSRQPVREAIIELERDGVVISKPKRGTFVGQFNARTVREHHAVYGLLEGYAARQLATTRNPDVISRLRELWKAAKAAKTPAQRVTIGSQFLNVLDAEGSDARLHALLRQIAQFVPKSYYAHISRIGMRRTA